MKELLKLKTIQVWVVLSICLIQANQVYSRVTFHYGTAVITWVHTSDGRLTGTLRCPGTGYCYANYGDRMWIYGYQIWVTASPVLPDDPDTPENEEVIDITVIE